ncbi:hypothetical protein HY285_01490 [Candidatus Peregrinibacteria bacterium]|nr:hypothetical protein [Candidatus Peregrinibacteria bacterium]MBI3816202.1 hypothetical protein [Candidatus Peregrinibacteria bacterium]
MNFSTRMRGIVLAVIIGGGALLAGFETFAILRWARGWTVLGDQSDTAQTSVDAVATRADVLLWAKAHGKDASWMNGSVLFLAKDGMYLMTDHRSGMGINLQELPTGLTPMPAEGLTFNHVPVGLPDVLRTSFTLEHFSATSLKGLSKEIAGTLTVSGSALTSLDDLPQKIGMLNLLHAKPLPLPLGRTIGKVILSIRNPAPIRDALAKRYNVVVMLAPEGTSAKPLGLEKEIWSDLSFVGVAGADSLTSLEGLPAIIHGSLTLNVTGINDLHGLPHQIDGSLNLANSVVPSLQGIPAKIGKDLNLSSTGVPGLQRISREIGGNLILKDIPAPTLPAGLKIGGTVIVSSLDSPLAKDAKKKGYAVTDH